MPAHGESVAADWSRSQEARLGPRRLLGLTGPALRLVWPASRWETVNLLVLQILPGLALPVQVLAGKWALDAALASGRDGAGMGAALPEIGVALAALETPAFHGRLVRAQREAVLRAANMVHDLARIVSSFALQAASYAGSDA